MRQIVIKKEKTFIKPILLKHKKSIGKRFGRPEHNDLEAVQLIVKSKPRRGEKNASMRSDRNQTPRQHIRGEILASHTRHTNSIVRGRSQHIRLRHQPLIPSIPKQSPTTRRSSAATALDPVAYRPGKATRDVTK